MSKIIKRVISSVLVFATLVSLLSGCKLSSNNSFSTSAPESTMRNEDNTNQPDTPESTGWVDDDTKYPDTTDETIEEIIQPVESLSYSEKWEDYLGDIETFVYGLLINTLENTYDVFSAEVVLSDGYSVLGLAYTDYSECYAPENDEYSECCFAAGFIPLAEELQIDSEEYESGLEVINLDFSDGKTSFYLAYACEPFIDHCVVYNQYLKYGVDTNGCIYYESTEYIDRQCDETLGDLYSYDKGKYLFVTDVGEYDAITGESLSSKIDYEALEKEINVILDEQDTNFSTVDLSSYAYFAQEAITSYLLSLQTETFLGYDVQLLIDEAKKLDPLECIRIGPDGLSTISIEELPNPTASDLTKWLVGTGCVIVAAVGVVGSIVFVECPPLSSACSAAMGVAIDMFMQVVIDEKTLDNVDWTKVAIAAATGAVSGFLGPYVMATYEGAAYFVVDSALDGLISGIEKSVTAWLDGERGTDVLKEFGTGFAIGFALSGAFKAVGKVLEKAVNKSSKLFEKIMPKLTKKVSEFTETLMKPLYALKSKADTSIFHSQYISNKLTARQLARIISNGDEKLYKKSLDALKKGDIYDNNNNLIDKVKLTELFEKAQNGDNLGYFMIGDEKITIEKVNGMVSIFFDSSKYQTVYVDLKNDRDFNMLTATELLLNDWKKNPDHIPETIVEALKAKGVLIDDIDNIEPKAMLEIIKKSDWVLHENADLKSVILVPRALHDKVKNWGGIAHMGGYGLIDYLKTHMGQEFFDRILQAVSGWTAEKIAQGS